VTHQLTSGVIAATASARELDHRYGDAPIGTVESVPRGVLVGGNQGSSVFRRLDLQPRTRQVIAHAGNHIELLSSHQTFWF